MTTGTGNPTVDGIVYGLTIAALVIGNNLIMYELAKTQARKAVRDDYKTRQEIKELIAEHAEP